MKAILSIALFAAAVSAQAQSPPVAGEVRKVDAASGMLTVRHGGIEHLDMPPMTVALRVRNRAWLASLQPGDRIRFTAEKVGGRVTVTSLERSK